ncbi:MAG: NAD-dependent epimerase/dehydratase family protein [Bacteroidetes bacterium]|nr:MAG: NAD-dependent epimerase/dehydratase family protein [Bacteroidota bacterium]
MSGKTALLFGATGLVGGELLQLLLEDDDYSLVHVFTRREIPVRHPKLKLHLIDFSKLEKYKNLIRGDHLFCCLGTTMKKAGSRAAFREVDYHYPMLLAEMASQNQVSKYLVVSSVGANPNSFFFYSRVKGEMERGIQLYPFEQISILRPSLLLGQRSEKRLGEDIGKTLNTLLSPFMQGPLKKYRGIAGKTVALAMQYLARYPQQQVVFESHELELLAQEAQAATSQKN